VNEGVVLSDDVFECDGNVILFFDINLQCSERSRR
jgi:hypothetical protein